jgi:hypothetical protein
MNAASAPAFPEAISFKHGHFVQEWPFFLALPYTPGSLTSAFFNVESDLRLSVKNRLPQQSYS